MTRGIVTEKGQLELIGIVLLEEPSVNGMVSPHFMKDIIRLPLS